MKSAYLINLIIQPVISEASATQHCLDLAVPAGHSADRSSHQDRGETRDNARKKVEKEASGWTG